MIIIIIIKRIAAGFKSDKRVGKMNSILDLLSILFIKYRSHCRRFEP